MQSLKLEFPGHDGSLLAARLDLPAGPPRAWVLFAHCFTCGKDIFAASRISAGLVESGLAVLRFDFTGLGASEGEFANTSFSSNVADLVCAAEHLREHHQAPTVLVGHSLGGAAVLAAAQDIAEVKAVVTIGAPAEPVHVKHLFDGHVDAIREQGALEVDLGGRPFTITSDFLDDLEETRIRDRVSKLGRALLVMHSPRDEIVDVDQARRIYEAALHPKSFVSLDSADHLLRKHADATYVARVIAVWAERYLPAMAEQEAPEEGVVAVSQVDPEGFTCTLRAGRHTQIADEPEAMGGADLGPSPYDYLLAGLGACTAMTLRMYARRKKLALGEVSVRLRQRRVHAADCEECEDKSGQITEITREIRIDGDLSDEQRQRLIEIADKCPVHRTLTEPIRIVTTPVGD